MRNTSSKYSMETFSPVGLHVLVVDDDPLCLMVLDRMLEKCNYKDLLRNSQDFDLVLSDVYMPDVDGFKLLEIIELELDLPVIMMSANDDTIAVMKGIIHGACDYLIKPVRMEELRNIWQHVIRRKGICSPTVGFCSDWNESTRAHELPECTSKKRKEDNISVEGLVDDINGFKKARLNWSVHLHQNFVNAVNQLGVKKSVPSKVLDIMNVQDLTRENVASHLQKYRMYLKRLNGLFPEPCPISTFQVSQDGTSGGTMLVLAGGKASRSPPVVKGLNFGAGLAGSNTEGESIDAGTMISLAQLKATQQQKQASVNRAQVLNGIGFVYQDLLSTSPAGGLHRNHLTFQKNDPPAWKSLPNNALGDLAASGCKGAKLEKEMSPRSCRPQLEGFLNQWEIKPHCAHDVRPDAAANMSTQENKLLVNLPNYEGNKRAVGRIEIPDYVRSFSLSDELLSSLMLTEMNRETFLGFNFNALEGLSISAPDSLVQNPEQLNISEYLLDKASSPFDD